MEFFILFLGGLSEVQALSVRLWLMEELLIFSNSEPVKIRISPARRFRSTYAV